MLFTSMQKLGCLLKAYGKIRIVWLGRGTSENLTWVWFLGFFFSVLLHQRCCGSQFSYSANAENKKWISLRGKLNSYRISKAMIHESWQLYPKSPHSFKLLEYWATDVLLAATLQGLCTLQGWIFTKLEGFPVPKTSVHVTKFWIWPASSTCMGGQMAQVFP